MEASVRSHFQSKDTFVALLPHVRIPPNTVNVKVHYSFNMAQQVHYPSDPLQSGPMYFLIPWKCTIFGVYLTEAADTGRGATGRGATGKGATGKDATGKGTTGKGTTGKGTTGKGTTGKGTTGKGTTGKGTTGKGTTGKGTTGKGTTGKGTTGKGTTGKGTNSIISHLHHFLPVTLWGNSMYRQCMLTMYADNCIEQNKNNAMLQYLSW